MARRHETAPEIAVACRADLRDWLMKNYACADGAWAVTWKKHVTGKHVAWSEVVDEALCFGWIDSLPRSKDPDRTMVYLAPRRPGSNWSRINKEKIARLEAEGRMHPSGQDAVARARSDGSWTALDEVEDLVVPPDLAEALSAEPGARAVWDGFPRSVRRGALEQLLNARRAETRVARIGIIVDAASRGERPFQWRKS